MNLFRITALVKRNLTLNYRGLDPWYDLFYWPVFDLMLWGFTSRWIEGPHQTSVSLIWLSGVVLWQGCVRANLDMPLCFLVELWSCNVVTLFASPLKLREWVVSAMIVGLVNTLTVVTFGSVMAYFMYGINILSIGWLIIPMFLLLLQSGWTLGFLSAGVIMTGGLKVQKVIWVLGWCFGPFSAIFYAVESLPEWARIITKVVPMSYVFEGMRSYVTSGVFPHTYLLTAFLMNCLYSAGTLYFLVAMFRKSRISGLARLEAE